MIPFLLAIDDDPGRYDYLRLLLKQRGVDLRVVCCAPCVTEALSLGPVAVLLDHDLSEECSCGMPTLTNTRSYLDDIVVSGRPVVVTSCSAPHNRSFLTDYLRDRGVKVRQHSADSLGCEWAWLGMLWYAGVLPAPGEPVNWTPGD